MSLAQHYLETSIDTFRSMKKLGDRALAQAVDLDISWTPDPESNSVATIVKHISGNMISRWTDFLTTDGEKPDRDRDSEFLDTIATHQELLIVWERGWDRLFSTLEGLVEEDLETTVYIRREPHSVVQAISRQVSHYAYHVGQIVYVVKHQLSGDWRTLSIARGKSDEWQR